MKPDSQTTVEEVQKYLKDGWIEGVECPCCKQYVRLWKQSLHSGQARWLIALVREYADTQDWVSVQHINAAAGMRGGDYAKLMYWGLIEQGSNDDSEKRASGNWRPTEKGMRFVHQELRIPKYVYTYDSKVKGFDSKQIDIIDSLGKKFDYEQLMHNS